jgi:hypothetical protein
MSIYLPYYDPVYGGPVLDAAAVLALFDQVKSHAMTLGVFDRVNTHEPKNAPGNGLTCSIWMDVIEPLPDASGLAQTSGRIAFHVRVMSNMLQEPQDDIDPQIFTAVVTLLAEYSGHFTLGGNVRDVDLLGAHGTALSAQAGYLDVDRKLYRVMVITLPLIINDLWVQNA